MGLCGIARQPQGEIGVGDGEVFVLGYAALVVEHSSRCSGEVPRRPTGAGCDRSWCMSCGLDIVPDRGGSAARSEPRSKTSALDDAAAIAEEHDVRSTTGCWPRSRCSGSATDPEEIVSFVLERVAQPDERVDASVLPAGRRQRVLWKRAGTHPTTSASGRSSAGEAPEPGMTQRGVNGVRIGPQATSAAVSARAASRSTRARQF